jgi:rhodanese-related sulfurtransferase
MGGKSNFDTTRLPALLDELQTAFSDRATFDNFLHPFVERLCEAKTYNLHDVWNAEIYSEKGDALREKLAAFKAARDSGDAALEASAAAELANAFVIAVRTYNQAMKMHIPDRAEEPDEGAFVYAIANVVNSNLWPALKSLGAKAVSIYFDMKSAKAKEQASAERMEGSLQRVQAYVNTFAGGAVDVATVRAIERISQNFQHPLNMPGTDGRAGSLKGNANRALFLSTLRFNLDLLENELRLEGILTDETTSEMKTHFARIAMQFFADRVGGIGEAVQKLSNANYTGLYDEAYAQEINSSKLLVRDALVHLRFSMLS